MNAITAALLRERGFTVRPDAYSEGQIARGAGVYGILWRSSGTRTGWRWLDPEWSHIRTFTTMDEIDTLLKLFGGP